MAINFLNTVAVDENVLFVDATNNRVGVGTSTPGSVLDVQGTQGQLFSVTDDLSGEIFAVSDISGVPIMTVNSSGVSYFDGNVGIGTTSPSAKLEVSDDNTIKTAIHIDNTSTGGHRWDIASIGSGVSGRVGNLQIRNDSDTLNIVEITGGGNVGIGVTAPQKKLSVYGDTLIESSGLTASLWFRPSATYTSGGIQTMKVTGSGNPYHTTISFSNYSAANVLNIVNDKVGIGTTLPGDKLHVEGGIIIQNGNNLQWGGLYSAGAPTIYASTNYLHFVPTGSTGAAGRQMRLDITGLGIGTSSPSEKLDVNGNVKIKDALLSNQEELDASIGVNVIANVAIATYTAAFFDFVIKKVGNIRSGTVYACHDGTNVEFTETSTNDLGNTSDVTLSVDISGANMRLIATTISDEWEIKSLIRAI
jgi:hypothetical protein